MSPALLTCTPESIFSAALRAASVKLSCDPSLGHAYLVPFKRNGVAQAELIIGYKGLYQIALRSNTYKTVNISVIGRTLRLRRRPQPLHKRDPRHGLFQVNYFLINEYSPKVRVILTIDPNNPLFNKRRN